MAANMPSAIPEMILVAPRSLALVDRDGEIVTLDALHIVAIKNLRARTNAATKR
jgi:predicted transposase YbfD/YdcC